MQPSAVGYLKAAFCAVIVIGLSLLLWFGSDAFLLAFAGVLLAIALRSAARLVSRLTGASPRWSLAIAVIVLSAAFVGAAMFVGPRIAAQTDQLRIDLPHAWSQAQEKLGHYEWGRQLIGQIPGPGQILSGGFRGGGILNAFSTVISATGSIVIVGFLGLYFAIDPGLYRRGVLQLVPEARRQRAGEVFDRVGDQLQHWLLGKLALMLFVGAATSLGLWILDMPLVVTLALMAALLDFIPNIGPILSAIPALLLALPQGPSEMMWVAGLYLAVQVVESYILQPLVQQQAVALPPALTLLGQVLIGTLFGALGLILATPLTVVLLNMIQMLYVQDFLGRQSQT